MWITANYQGDPERCRSVRICSKNWWRSTFACRPQNVFGVGRGEGFVKCQFLTVCHLGHKPWLPSHGCMAGRCLLNSFSCETILKSQTTIQNGGLFNEDGAFLAKWLLVIRRKQLWEYIYIIILYIYIYIYIQNDIYIYIILYFIYYILYILYYILYIIFYILYMMYYLIYYILYIIYYILYIIYYILYIIYDVLYLIYYILCMIYNI